MRFDETKLHGAWLVEPAATRDHRGFFARTFCAREYADHSLTTRFVQHSTSQSAARGTLRGMHFQRAPHGEVKVVSCLKGAIWDVIIDLRPHSPTYRQWQGFELTTENRRQLYVPDGFAHGFQTLCDDTEVGYLISAFYAPQAAAGVRYDDPAFAIVWPLPLTVISERDTSWPDFLDPTLTAELTDMPRRAAGRRRSRREAAEAWRGVCQDSERISLLSNKGER